jgi:predicted MPP superfamily phosphohydrolase
MDPRTSRLTRRAALLGFAAATVAPAVARAAQAPRRNHFALEHVDVRLASLDPAHDGLLVVQLSDLHIGWGVPEPRIAAAIAAVNALKPDLVVLTGDFITTKRDSVAAVPELLRELQVPSVAVLGNHDHWTYPAELTSALEGLGISVLRNQHTAVQLRGAPFSVIGIDDGATKHDDAVAAFRGAPTRSALVLTHTPAAAKHLPDGAGVLCLSGHTHGGQLEVGNLTGDLFRAFGQPWYRGSYGVNGNRLYVNRGLGFGRGTAYPRLNSEPEVTLFTLRHDEVA